MRAGTQDEVFVTVELETKTMGKIEGRSGVHWQPQDEQLGGD